MALITEHAHEHSGWTGGAVPRGVYSLFFVRSGKDLPLATSDGIL